MSCRTVGWPLPGPGSLPLFILWIFSMPSSTSSFQGRSSLEKAPAPTPAPTCSLSVSTNSVMSHTTALLLLLLSLNHQLALSPYNPLSKHKQTNKTVYFSFCSNIKLFSALICLTPFPDSVFFSPPKVLSSLFRHKVETHWRPAECLESSQKYTDISKDIKDTEVTGSFILGSRFPSAMQWSCSLLHPNACLLPEEGSWEGIK